VADHTLEWLHPDGRVGGRTAEGRVVWSREAVLGDRWESGVPSPTSPHRREPTCRVSDRCGGCDLDRVTHDRRLAALSSMVARAYRLDEDVPVESSPQVRGTRARVKLAVSDGRVGYRPRRSHDLVAITECDTARAELQPVIARAAEVTWPEELSSVELRSDGRRVMASLKRAGRSRRRRGPEVGELPDLGVPLALDGRPVAGDPTLWLSVAGRQLRVSPLSFYQVHLELNESLVRWVADQVMGVRPERVLDLYAGIGNLGLPLAAAGVPVVAVELEGQATSDLRHNADGLEVEVITGKVERFDPSTTPFDAVVVDPPRAGAGAVIDAVLRNRPRVVVHVACDPVAGARDAARARKAGYRITSVRCFDLFPQTHHVETVSVWAR